ncbi:hypothetical protein KR059_009163 [Drosophila kikkawai]|nr:hypothetical protein KR059_009163 [Drosophila kikkawai]
MSQKDSTNDFDYFSEPEDVLPWKAIDQGSSERHLMMYPKKGVSLKRKRSSDPKKSPKIKTGNRRRLKYQADGVDDIELCAKRMKCMSLQNVKTPKKKQVNPDAGYEGDSETEA